VSDVEVVVITAIPTERFAVRNAFKVACINPMTVEHLLLGVAEVASHNSDDSHI